MAAESAMVGLVCRDLDVQGSHSNDEVLSSALNPLADGYTKEIDRL